MKYMFGKTKLRDIMLFSWVLLNAIFNYWNELLWNVYGAIYCVVISNLVE